jgi:hypothetical protein
MTGMCPRTPLIVAFLALHGCAGDIYLRDGVTDGDTFYLSQQAMMEDDAVTQSWVRYSLARSACKLAIGGDNPARNSSYECELTARRHLVTAWSDYEVFSNQGGGRYLNELQQVSERGYLEEYVAHHFRRRHWHMPEDLDLSGYRRWEKRSLPEHRPETRLKGSWNYAGKVTADGA